MSVFPSDGKLPHATECKKSTQSSNDLSLRVVPFNIQIKLRIWYWKWWANETEFEFRTLHLSK